MPLQVQSSYVSPKIVRSVLGRAPFVVEFRIISDDKGVLCRVAAEVRKYEVQGKDNRMWYRRIRGLKRAERVHPVCPIASERARLC
jgi:hypothetical protein